MESFWEKIDRYAYCFCSILIYCVLVVYPTFVDVVPLEPI